MELNIKDEPTYYTKQTTSEEEKYENSSCTYEKQKKTNKFTSQN